MNPQRGQVLAFFALLLPLVLLPVVAYAIDEAVIGAEFGALQAVTAQAAEVAAQQIDIAEVRSTGTLAVDEKQARLAAQAMVSVEEPAAAVESIELRGAIITVATSEKIDLPLALTGGSVTLHVRASARLVAGYDSPSSRLPFSTSTF